MTNKYGALPPPGLEWQVGKTAASISFVYDAEIFLKSCHDTKKTDLLLAAIQQVKDGSLVFNEWTTPEEYLDKKL